MLAEGNVVAAEVELRKALAAKYPEEVVVPDLARSMLMLGKAKKVVDEFGGTRLGKPSGRRQPADHVGSRLCRAGQVRTGASGIERRAGGRSAGMRRRCCSARGRRQAQGTSTARWR